MAINVMWLTPVNCCRDRDALIVSGRKWKDRARSCERQVEKLHQLLQNIATLLQLHGYV